MAERQNESVNDEAAAGCASIIGLCVTFVLGIALAFVVHAGLKDYDALKARVKVLEEAATNGP